MMQAQALKLAMADFAEDTLRKIDRYEEHSEQVQDMVDRIRQEFYTALQYREVTLD